MPPEYAPRFWARVDKTGGCWEWRGYRNTQGYGAFPFKHPELGWVLVLAYRLSYLLTNGPVRDGLELDHVCRNRGCCNPAHLEPVTHRENLVRGHPFGAQHSLTTHCPQGHEYAGDNLSLHRKKNRQGKDYVSRECRACKREAERKRKQRRLSGAR